VTGGVALFCSNKASKGIKKFRTTEKWQLNVLYLDWTLDLKSPFKKS